MDSDQQADCITTLTALADVPLSSGVPVTNLSGSRGLQQTFFISVPAGQDFLTVALSGGTGDADLYVRAGAMPTTSTFDCRPFATGNNERCAFDNPVANTYFVMINGFSDYAGATLVATFGTISVRDLGDNVPVTNLSGAAGSQTFFRLAVPAGQGQAVFSISGGTGDADLYVRAGARPTLSAFDCRLGNIASNNEICSIVDPVAGDYFVMLNGAVAYTGVTLVATSRPDRVLDNNAPAADLSSSTGTPTFFKLAVPPGQGQVVFTLGGGTGNADLYVRAGSKPTLTTFDCRSALLGGTETCTLLNPVAGDYFVMLTGFYAGATLVGAFGPDPSLVLGNNVPVTGLSGAANSETMFKLAVPPGQTQVVFTISGGTGDPDLYVRRAAKPTSVTFDCGPFIVRPRTCTFANPVAGDYFVMLRGSSAYQGVTLVGHFP